jgi:Concanavalin A-like lectin/glucanases superfamily
MKAALRWCWVLALVAGCGESLFDSHGGVDGGGDDGDVPSTCPMPCLADAAADFDGSAAGSTGHWRYLDDHRDRTWAAMTTGTEMTGADPANQITSCATRGSAAACGKLPGALLVSSAGATATADPSLELTTTEAAVVQLSLRVHVPSGSDDQEIRLYRNSREDVLATATAIAGTTLDRAITVEALAGDRFLVAVAPTMRGATDVGVHMFVNATGAAFPGKCQLAASFASAAGTTVANLCGPANTLTNNNDAGAIPAVLGAGPFAEQGMAADIAPDTFYKGDTILDKNGDTTIQMWVKHDAFVSPYDGWIFSDYDLNLGGGIGLVIYNPSTPTLEYGTCTDPGNPLMFAQKAVAYPTDGGWHFIRLVHANGSVELCLDGKHQATLPVPAGALKSSFPPHVGRNVVWTPQVASFDGHVDDLRVLSTALPCQ